ncbi:MAG TPA: TetR/AcrR family transcriptional regulator [Afipia sp.]
MRPSENGDSAKRIQILEGARTIFMSRGYDAASMGEIAKSAGVSKGTLYVYFTDKNKLFHAIVDWQCSLQGFVSLTIDLDGDVEKVLNTIGQTYMELLCRPNGGSTIRTVMAIAERMPAAGRCYYKNVAGAWQEKVSAFLRKQVDSGRLTVNDCDLAASQFLLSCQATLFTPFIFQASPAPSSAHIRIVVESATRMFLSAYKPVTSDLIPDDGAAAMTTTS